MCYIAILYFAACQCRHLYHIHCDRGDPPPLLCEGGDRYMVAKYTYAGRCEQCIDRAWIEESEERQCHLQDQLEDLRVECLAKGQETTYHENLVKRYQMRERFAEERLENESDDIDFAIEWVKEHTKAVWNGDEDSVRKLGYMQGCDMKVKLNKDLKKPEDLQIKREPEEPIPIPTGWKKFVRESTPGPSRTTRAETPGPEPTSTEREVSVAESEATLWGSGCETEPEDEGYVGKGKGKAVATHDDTEQALSKLDGPNQAMVEALMLLKSVE